MKINFLAPVKDGVVEAKARVLRGGRVIPIDVDVFNQNKLVAKAIADMVTQSAGPYTAAGMGMALAAHECSNLSYKDQINYLEDAAFTLANARPTTANRMTLVVQGCLRVAKAAMENGNKVDERAL